MYKDLCNDVRRLILVYLISIPIETWLSGSKESVTEFKADLLNDILSVICYYEFIRYAPYIEQGSNTQLIVKTTTLLTVNGYLTNGTIDYNKVVIGILINFGLHHLLMPIINITKEKYNVDISNIKGSLETVILLSVANNNIYDTISKSISLLLFQYFLKW